MRNESERMRIVFSDIHHVAHCDLMPWCHTVSVEFHEIQKTAFLKERTSCMQHRGTRKHNRTENSNIAAVAIGREVHKNMTLNVS